MESINFWGVLSYFDIWTVAIVMAVALFCLSFKEPVLALKLEEKNISVTVTGFIFTLDTLAFMISAFCLNFVKEEQNGRKYGRL